MKRMFALMVVLGIVVLFSSCSTVSKNEGVRKYGDAVVLFNGKDLSNWRLNGPAENNKWVIGTAVATPIGQGRPRIINADSSETSLNEADDNEIVRGTDLINLGSAYGESIDIYSNEIFDDCLVELEFMIPISSNSGIYLMGEYEVQIRDSWGSQRLNINTVGAISNTQAPTANASKESGQWQKFVIDFQAPRFNTAGEKTANAKFIKVELNGQVIIENCEVPDVIPAGLTGKESAAGPLLLQGMEGSVAFRNIIVRPVIK